MSTHQNPAKTWRSTRSTSKKPQKILQEGRRAGAKEFFNAGGQNFEVGLLCTGDDDVEEHSKMYGLQCSMGCDADPGCFKKMMWNDMKEFNLYLRSSSCDREMTFTQRVREWKWADVPAEHPGAPDEVEPIHNKGKMWHSWDHYPAYATIREDEGQGYLI